MILRLIIVFFPTAILDDQKLIPIQPPTTKLNHTIFSQKWSEMND